MGSDRIVSCCEGQVRQPLWSALLKRSKQNSEVPEYSSTRKNDSQSTEWLHKKATGLISIAVKCHAQDWWLAWLVPTAAVLLRHPARVNVQSWKSISTHWTVCLNVRSSTVGKQLNARCSARHSFQTKPAGYIPEHMQLGVLQETLTLSKTWRPDTIW